MQKSSRRIALVCGVVGAAAVGLSWSGWFTPERPPNILFITLDTTRADRLGAYGYPGARTPVLDQFAKDGVLFEHAISPAPLTLAVHASLFTGLYPPEHGLRTNGLGSLPKDKVTLSEILVRHGYETGGFVASFVLDRKFGLARGFHEYDDHLAEAKPTQDSIHRFRDGRLVVDSALKWLAKPRSKPFFCWVHLYDPHAPYEPRTAEFGNDFADSLYDGEIAYTDRQVGRLLEYLSHYPRTVVVIVGDHGESLGDHDELQHGYTLYSSTQQVPLMVRGVPDAVPGTRISAGVSLVDVFPTLLDLLNLPVTDPISGQSFLPALRGGALSPRDCYGATDDPFLQNGWSPLRSLTTDRYRYIRTTKPELYDLQSDPRELNNLAGSDPERLAAMESQLADLESRLAVSEAATVQLSAAEQRALASLGYAGGKDAVETPQENSLPDVKDMLPFNVRTQAAIDLMDQGKLAEAEALLAVIVAESPPEHVSSRLYLGSTRERQGRPREAEEIYQAVLARRPDDTNALFHLGGLYADQGRFAEAAVIFEKCLVTEPESAQPLFNLGLAKVRLGEAEAAERHFEDVLQIDPAFPGAWAALGNLLSRQGRTAEAIAALETELELDGNSVESHVNLGVLLGGQQRLEEAHQHLTEAVRIAPESADARFNLGICAGMLKRYDSAIIELREAVRLRPEVPGVRTALGNILAKTSRQDEAIAAYEAELKLTPTWLEAHVNLGALLGEQQRFAAAITQLEAALRLDPKSVEALYNLGAIHARRNERDLAKQHLERALRLQPNHARATVELTKLRSSP